MRLYLTIISTFLLSSCATLSQDECMRGDWFGLGVRDGVAGQQVNRLSAHAEACAEYLISPDSQQYLSGREQGLQHYCQLNNAFIEGLNGRPYQHVCPAERDALFSHYHAAAYALYQQRAELAQIDNDIYSRKSRLSDKKLSDKDRERLRYEIRSLDMTHHRLRGELYFYERQLDNLRLDAQRYR